MKGPEQAAKGFVPLHKNIGGFPLILRGENPY